MTIHSSGECLAATRLPDGALIPYKPKAANGCQTLTKTSWLYDIIQTYLDYMAMIQIGLDLI
jgi:hypothetical protein